MFTEEKTLSQSRIGKKPIQLIDGVSLTRSPEGKVSVVGPKGSLHCLMNPEIGVSVDDQGFVVLTRPTEQKRHKALHGLYRSLINNMIIGVTAGYTKSLEVIGVGYKAVAEENLLKLEVGYAHAVYIAMPASVKIKTESIKGKPVTITLESIDKQLLGHVAAKIRSVRKPEPYKGKGIRIVGEEIRLKAGKSGKK